MEDLLSTELYAGMTLGEFVSLEFLASILGNILAAIVVFRRRRTTA